MTQTHELKPCNDMELIQNLVTENELSSDDLDKVSDVNGAWFRIQRKIERMNTRPYTGEAGVEVDIDDLYQEYLSDEAGWGDDGHRVSRSDFKKVYQYQASHAANQGGWVEIDRDIQPCPFCGEKEDIIDNGSVISCGFCGGRSGDPNASQYDVKDRFEAWNRSSGIILLSEVPQHWIDENRSNGGYVDIFNRSGARFPDSTWKEGYNGFAWHSASGYEISEPTHAMLSPNPPIKD